MSHPPEPETKRGALPGTPDFIRKHQHNQNSAAEQIAQPETAPSTRVAAASSALLASPLVLRALADAKLHGGIEQVLEAAPPPQVATPVRQKRRAGDWHSEAYRTAAAARRRYVGQSEQIDQALADELARGPDFARCHRGSLFKEPPKNNLDRNFLARLWFVAQTIERKSWACKKKGKHGGTLGRAALEVLRALLFVIKKIGGKLFPSIETLAMLCRMSKQTVITALKVLERMGFITAHKRIKRIQTPLGARVVQDSNAYEFHFPKTGLGKLAMAVFCGRSSESNKSDAMSTSYKPGEETNIDQDPKDAERGFAGKEADRWWLHAPLQTGNGGWK
jgi:hypothetical protein